MRKQFTFFAACMMLARIGMAQSAVGDALMELGGPTMPVRSERAAQVDYKGSVFGSKTAGDTIKAWRFSGANNTDDMPTVYGTSGVVTGGTVVGGEIIPANTVSQNCGKWQYVPDTGWFDAYNFSSEYPTLSGSWWVTTRWMIRDLGSHFMLMSMIDLPAWSSQFPNAYMQFAPVPRPSGVSVVKVAIKQEYRKYYDQCWIDYKVNNDWYTREINVTGIDVDVNEWGALNTEYTMPLELATQNNIELRIRYSGTTRNVQVHGYFWAIGEVAIIEGAASSLQYYGDNYLEGAYSVIPQGLQLPLTWYAPVLNDGVTTQTGVSVSLQHTSPGGTTSLIETQSQPNIAAMTQDTVVVDGRGFYSSTFLGWYGYSANYGTATTVTNTGLPTNVPGHHSVQALLGTNDLSHTYTVRNYRVSTDDSGVYTWARDNGVLASAPSGTHGYTLGYTDEEINGNRYISDEGHYSTEGYQVMLRYTTGNTIPTDWVMRGLEMVVDQSWNGNDIAGAQIAPVIWKASYHEDGSQISFDEVATGVISYTVTGNEANYLSSGYLMPGSYNTVRLLFPNQPELEPNTSYYVGYKLLADADFSLAVSRNRYVNYDGDGNTVYMQFSADSTLLPYVNNLKPNRYDVFVKDPVGNGLWAALYNDNIPMIRPLLGPRIELPTHDIFVSCDGAGVTQFNNNVCGMSLSLGQGGDYSLNIYPYDSLAIDGISIDGVPLVIDPENPNFDSNLTVSYSYSYSTNDYQIHYTYTFRNLTADHIISVTAGVPPAPVIPVGISCTGNGSGAVYRSEDNAVNLCGMTDSVTSGFVASYNFIPTIGTLTHLYVNNVDRIAEVSYNGSGSSVSMYSYSFAPTEATSLQAVFSYCDTIDTFPYVMDFEGGDGVSCWTTIDADGDGHIWDFAYGENMGHNGSTTCLGSLSYDNQTGALYPDNWVVLPAMVLPANSGVVLKWYDKVFDQYYSQDYYSVYVSTTGNSVSDFSTVLYSGYPSFYYWTERTVDLSDYAGQTVYIAFRHYNCSDMYLIGIDDITVMAGNIVSISCSGDGYGHVTHSDNYSENLCGTTEQVPSGFVASYDFIAYEGELSHLYVNNVDRINDVVASGSGTSVSTYSFTVNGPTSINAVFNYPTYPVAFNCSGDGEGVVYNMEYYTDNLCGEVDEVRQGFLASYEFYPINGSEMTHLYVNNIDCINDAYGHSYGSYSSTIDYYTYSFPVNEATTVMPVFSRIPYTITATTSDPAMGMVSGGGSYFYDSTATITATPMPHYRLLHWLLVYDGSDTMMFTQEMAAEDGISFNPLQFEVWDNLELIAVFGPESYTITVSPNNVLYGSATGGGTFEYLTPVTVTASAYSGYHFLMWSNGSTYNPYTFPASEDLDLQAIFAADDDTAQYFTITVSANNDEMGTVEGGGVYPMGGTASLTATPYSGYHFVQWNDGNTDNPRTVMVTANVTYTAYFASDQGVTYTVIAVAENDSMGTVTGGGTYAPGEEITLTAIPNDGYRFEYWQDSSRTNPRTIIVSENATYVATFVPTENAIGDVDVDPAMVYSFADRIHVRGTQGRTVKVFDINGRMLTRVDRAADVLEFNMQHTGVYIVTIGNATYRVVVKH